MKKIKIVYQDDKAVSLLAQSLKSFLSAKGITLTRSIYPDINNCDYLITVIKGKGGTQ